MDWNLCWEEIIDDVINFCSKWASQKASKVVSALFVGTFEFSMYGTSFLSKNREPLCLCSFQNPLGRSGNCSYVENGTKSCQEFSRRMYFRSFALDILDSYMKNVMFLSFDIIIFPHFSDEMTFFYNHVQKWSWIILFLRKLCAYCKYNCFNNSALSQPWFSQKPNTEGILKKSFFQNLFSKKNF